MYVCNTFQGLKFTLCPVVPGGNYCPGQSPFVLAKKCTKIYLVQNEQLLLTVNFEPCKSLYISLPSSVTLTRDKNTWPLSPET